MKNTYNGFLQILFYLLSFASYAEMFYAIYCLRHIEYLKRIEIILFCGGLGLIFASVPRIIKGRSGIALLMVVIGIGTILGVLLVSISLGRV